MGHELTLVELLALWERTHDPRVADAIDVAGARVKPRVIAGKTLGAKLTAWAALAAKRDPDDVSTLVAFPFPKGIRALEQLVAGLIGLPADPRVAKRLTDLVVELPVDSWAGTALTAKGCDRVAALGDVRAVPRLLAVATARSGWVADRLRVPPAIEALSKVVPQRVADDVVAPFAVSVRDRALDDTFLAQIYANPDDDAAVTVYGDYLVEHGDPRGELIALQLAGEDGKRVQELIAAHGDEWAGAMRRWFPHPRGSFERGFLAGGRLELGEELGADPGWALVRTLSVKTLAVLGTWGAQLRELSVDELGSEQVFAQFPNLRALGIARDAGWCATAPVIERLERLHVVASPAVFEALAARSGVRQLSLYARDWTVRLSRATAPGPFTHVSARPDDGSADVRELAQHLAAIPAAWVRELVVTSRPIMLDASEVAPAEAALRRFTHATRIEVPWQRPERDDAASSLAIEFALDGDTTEEPRLPAVWATLVGFGQRYDVFTAGRGEARRPLGKDPVARVTKWMKDRYLDILNSGGRETVHLGRAGVSGTLVMRDRTTDQLRAFALALVDATGATHGAFGDRLHYFDVGKFTHHPRAGWLTILGPAFTRWLTPAELASLSSARLLTAGTSAVLELGEGPAQLASEQVDAFAAELRVLLARGYTRRHGYDFPAMVRAAFDPIAEEHGIPLQDETALEVRYHTQNFFEISASITLGTEPRINVFVRSGRRKEPPLWHQIVQGSVATAEQFRAALEASVLRMTELRAWFAGELRE